MNPDPTSVIRFALQAFALVLTAAASLVTLATFWASAAYVTMAAAAAARIRIID